MCCLCGIGTVLQLFVISQWLHAFFCLSSVWVETGAEGCGRTVQHVRLLDSYMAEQSGERAGMCVLSVVRWREGENERGRP